MPGLANAPHFCDLQPCIPAAPFCSNRCSPPTLLVSLNSLAKAAEISAVPQASRILVGFGAGGGIDLLARVLAESIAAQLGKSHYVVVDNKPGANGQIAAQTLLNAPSDGSTYLIAPLITPVLSQIVYKSPATILLATSLPWVCSRISSSGWPSPPSTRRAIFRNMWPGSRPTPTKPTSAAPPWAACRISSVCCWAKRPASTSCMCPTRVARP
jgi:hypothetical protein